MAVVVVRPFWDPVLVEIGEFTTHFRTYFGGDWEVHWGYDLDFDPGQIKSTPIGGAGRGVLLLFCVSVLLCGVLMMCVVLCDLFVIVCVLFG